MHAAPRTPPEPSLLARMKAHSSTFVRRMAGEWERFSLTPNQSHAVTNLLEGLRPFKKCDARSSWDGLYSTLTR